jgi:hypothetical protein
MEQDAKILTQGKNKRLLSYNKKHGMNFVKNMYHKNYRFVQDMGGSGVYCKRDQKLQVKKICIKKKKYSSISNHRFFY